MLKNIFVILLAGIFIIGQELFFLAQKPLAGVLISSLALVLGYLRFRENLSFKLSRRRFLFVLLFAVFAQLVITHSFILGLLGFGIGAALLLQGRQPAIGEIPRQVQPMKKWEPWFVMALLLLAIGSRFYLLNSSPLGALNQEGEGIGYYAGHMERSTYMAHTDDGDMEMPSMNFYAGAGAAKLFGWNVGSMRIPSAVWGVLSILALFFVARRLMSPESAALASLLYTASLLQLVLSRLFFPYAILFVSALLGFGLFLIALQRPKWHTFLLAGMATGLGLHGYYPGRGLFLIFLFWMAWLWFFRRSEFPAWKHLVIFWAGFGISGSTEIYAALFHSDTYWQYIRQHANSNSRQGLFANLRYLLENVPLYAKLFHVKSDWDYGFHLPYEPILDPLTGILFGLGFFLCLFSFWRPIPNFLLVLCIVGMIPPMLSTNCPHPNARRICLSLPAIYLIVGVAWDYLLQAVKTPNKKWLQRVLVLVAFLLAILTVAFNLHTYFGRFAEFPGTKMDYNYASYAAAEEIRRHPQVVYVQPHVISSLAGPALFPRQNNIRAQRLLGDLLILNPNQENLLLLEPYMEVSLPFFRKHFPGAAIKVYREEDPRYKTVNNFTSRATEPFNPPVYLIRILIPRQAAREFQDLLDKTRPGLPQPARAFDKTFSRQAANRYLKLAGAVLTQKGGSFQFQLDWKGWQLLIDGKPQAWGVPLPLGGNLHYFECRGTVPADAQGPMPLQVLQSGQNLVTQGRVVGLLPESGCEIFFTPGTEQEDQPAALALLELFPLRRFYDATELPLPFMARWKGIMTVPAGGQYQFQVPDFLRSRILINQQEVYNRWSDKSSPAIYPIQLKAGEPVKFKAYLKVRGELLVRTFLVSYKGPEQTEWTAMPVDWVKPDFSLEP